MGLAGFQRARREAKAKAEAVKPAEVTPIVEEIKKVARKKPKKESSLDVLSDDYK